MGMCTHDIACQVCFDASAIIVKDVNPFSNTPDYKKWSVQPCYDCQEKGFMIIKMPKLLRRFFK